MAKILAVGIATIDIINTTDKFPEEDEEIRAIGQEIRRGGNATNTLVVLSQLGHQCHWSGSLADDNNANTIVRDLGRYHINHNDAEIHQNSTTPTSYITLNKQNGSRTIVHFRDLPELSAAGFNATPVSLFDWIHFEGRNVADTQKMLAQAKKLNPLAPISIEIEKHRDGLPALFSGGDIYFFSKAFATAEKYSNAELFLRQYRSLIPNAILLCTWGSDGAFALEDQKLYYCKAPKLSTVVDTIGAGDTFNAGFIHASIEQKPVQDRLDFACNLAAKKCTINGLSNLV